MQTAILCLFIRKTGKFFFRRYQLLLARKKTKGFLAEKWAPIGCRTDKDETPEGAAIRETEQGLGIKIEPKALEKVGLLTVSFENNPNPKWQVIVFRIKKWQGEPKETEAAKPEWFDASAIPEASLLIEDKKWLPLILAGKKIKAEVIMNQIGTEVLKFSWQKTKFQ